MQSPDAVSRTSNVDRYLRAPQAAAFLGLSKATLAKFRCLGGGPVFHRAGARVILYRTADLIEWAEKSGPCRNTAQADGAF